MTDSPKIGRALLSVYDKTGIVDFARALHGEFGIELISTGGTAKTLKDAGLPVTPVEEVTGSPEMMDGRVKTLHPRIHAAILADRDNPEHMRQLAAQGIEPIDMVVVNLYPFEKTIARPDCTFAEALEMIDIGGPCLLRAAAKNHRHVLVVCEAGLQDVALRVLRQPEQSGSRRSLLAQRAYMQTCAYDGAISQWLGSGVAGDLPGARVLGMSEVSRTSYGENPHQAGIAYHLWGGAPRAGVLCDVLSGSTAPMSFNNYADAGAALELCAELTRAPGAAPRGTRAVCFIKHMNACGAAVHDDALEAYRRAYLGDPNAAMGGILAVNFEVDAAFAQNVMQTYQSWGKAAGASAFFVEVWLAPSFDDGAVDVIRTAKKWGPRVRLLSAGDLGVEPDPDDLDFKRIAGGLLMQTRDLIGLDEDQWKVVTERQPTAAELDDLRLAWLVCKHTKSNAITICKNGMLIGNGAGQTSRIMSCRIATWLARENRHDLTGAVAASDAFFPFRDGPDILAEAGVTALIQPGGSKRDDDTIQACNERGLAMIFTGTRHFRH